MTFMMQQSSMHCIHRVVKLSSVFKVIDRKSAHEQRGLFIIFLKMIKQAQTWQKLTQKPDSSLSGGVLGHFATSTAWLLCLQRWWGDDHKYRLTCAVNRTGYGPLSQDAWMYEPRRPVNPEPSKRSASQAWQEKQLPWNELRVWLQIRGASTLTSL